MRGQPVQSTLTVMHPHRASLTVLLVLAAPLLAACGGDDNGGDNTAKPAQATTPATTQPAAASGTLTIRMTEFAFDPKDAVAKAGKVTITAPNDGSAPHELVLLKTDADPAKLPMKGNEVDESTSVGEIADVEAGATKKHTFNLEPGKYAMVCALPGHYQSGMYGSLTVK
jgi:uncharacterized cupredoxin-like copper-binding protein